MIFWIFWAIASIIVLSFGAVLLVGAPYLPTLKDARKRSLDLLDLKPDQTLYELGSGDGSLLIEAARRGINCVGYELNPLLVTIAWFRSWRYRKHIKIVWGNYWRADLAPADAIFVFLLDKYMGKLDKKIEHDRAGKPVLLATHAFKVPGKKPTKRSGAVFLYKY